MCHDRPHEVMCPYSQVDKVVEILTTTVPTFKALATAAVLSKKAKKLTSTPKTSVGGNNTVESAACAIM